MDISLRGALAAALLWLLLTPASAKEVSVAVASNFAAPLEQLALLFNKETGHTLKLGAASTGKLYAQIKSGAQFDVFLAADEATPKQLVQDGLAVGSSRFSYAAGRLVLWSALPAFVDAGGTVLTAGNFNKLAIADPRLSPYGMAARETLEKLTMWNAIQRKLVKGENVAQTYQLVATENAELGFIALSQIMKDGKVSQGSWWLVPTALHKPIRQSAVLLSAAKDNEAAKALLAFLRSGKAQATLRGAGYEPP